MEMEKGGGESGQRPQGVSWDMQVVLSKVGGERVRQPDEQIKTMLCGSGKKTGMTVSERPVQLKCDDASRLMALCSE